ncbi:MAG: cupredoxin domain-containing protein [Thermoflexales bacterium]|nr:cupredoxin domain-containing protein [Thermoflexales bacterium]
MSSQRLSRGNSKQKQPWWRWLPIAGVLVGALAIGVWQVSSRTPDTQVREAPEAERILAVQANMPFQILIPAYLPPQFDRANVEIDVSQIGPGGEPMVHLAYRSSKGTMFFREWVPINPDKEILSGSRPIETQWGNGWLLKQGETLAAIWADVGPMRISAYSPDQKAVTVEQLLQMVNTLGPASNSQVFSFSVDLPSVRQVEPPPPYEVPIKDGVQEFTLVVTPGGYDPLRFSVQQGLPVRMTFRALGQVGCGKELVLPTDSRNTLSVYLKSDTEIRTVEFMPSEAGTFLFNCSHQMYRGVMTVRQ